MLSSWSGFPPRADARPRGGWQRVVRGGQGQVKRTRHQCARRTALLDIVEAEAGLADAHLEATPVLMRQVSQATERLHMMEKETT